jgi:hypothetical protein
MMYVCLDCGHLFSDADYWEERHGFDYGPFEQWSGCPVCGESYVEAHRCSCCDKWITGSYIKTEDGQRICENCYIVMELGDED